MKETATVWWLLKTSNANSLMANIPSVSSERTSFGSERSQSFGSRDDGMFSALSTEFPSDEEGYDYEFIPPPDDKYICPVCLHVLREPLQTECGHRFCKACILRWLREGKRACPICSTSLGQDRLFPDNFAKREILALSVRCPNYKQGCDVVLVLKQIELHIASCTFALVPCPNQCPDILLRRDIDNHVNTTCPRRRVLCSFCRLHFTAEELQMHTDNCPQVMVKCPNECGEEMLRGELRNHLKDECPKTKLQCEYYPIGCATVVERAEMKYHMVDDQLQHMNMLCRGIITLLNIEGITRLPAVPTPSSASRMSPTEVSGTSSFLQPSTLDSATPYMHLPAAHSISTESKEPQVGVKNNSDQSLAETDVKKSENRISENTQAVDTVSFISEQLSSGLGNEGAPRPQLLSLLNDNFSSMKTQNDIQDESLAKHHQEILELRQKNEHLEKQNREVRSKLRSLEALIHDFEGRVWNGTFVWKIRNYSRCRTEAENGHVIAIHSSSFYSSCYGYKLCIRVNLNGVDAAKGTHLSIFVHFMQGEHDDIIEWPFSGRIILSVMDQNPICEMRRHVVETLVSKPNLAAFQKPISGRNHKGFGYMEFLPFNILDNSTYIRNDTLIVKAQVITGTT